MQGKGFIRFFLVLLTIVCLIQYLFILPTNKVEKDAEEFAIEKTANITDAAELRTEKKRYVTRYLDSMSSEEILSIPLIGSYTYEELKKQQLALGLDLKGGLSTVLQVDIRKFIEALSEYSDDPQFQQALEQASERLKQTQTDYVTLFAEEYAKVGSEGGLAQIFTRNEGLRDEISFNTTNREVINIIRQKADETVDLTFKRLKDRIDKFGVTQPNVSLDESRDLILVELPGISNPERARNYLQATAKLEFWNIYRATDRGIMESFRAADEKLKTLVGNQEEETVVDSIMEYQYDSLGNVVDSSLVAQESDLVEKGPLTELMDLNQAVGGQLTMYRSVVGMAEKNKRQQILEYLNKPAIKKLFPKNVKFLWSSKPSKDFETGAYTDRYMLYAINTEGNPNEAPLEGDHVVSAAPQPDPQTNQVTVSLRMDKTGARIWAKMTTEAYQDNEREIAIVLDDEVVSAPSVNSPITGGNSSITGDFSIQEAQDLSNILQVGKLPAETSIIQESLVGPSLGKDNIRSSITSLLIGFGLVLVFMMFYYGGGGIVSIIALFLNLFFIFGALASYGTVLTLPGIAGIVLTIGMAVDANVIIYERIREELRAGKSLLAGISDGFRNSYSAIIDANVTTILTAIVLSYFGLGPIKGFAVVLIIGVLCSLFTAVLVGRLIIDWWTITRGKNLSFYTNFSKGLFSNLNIDWLGKRRIAYIVSGIVIVAGIASFLPRGFEMGVDFRGGHSYNVQFEGEAPDIGTLRASLTEAFGAEPVVKAVSTANTYNVTTSYLIDDNSEDADQQVMQKLFEGVNSVTSNDLSLNEFAQPDGVGTHVASSAKVGPTIADDIKKSSVYATIFALLLIFLYIFIRFSKWQYSMGAVAALFHDTLVVLSIFSILHGMVPFSLEIDQAFIAALLTVIGYSINDTVVVFDRIREFFNSYLDMSKEEVINSAINNTLSRTVITSLTTLFVVLILFLFGGDSIKGFAFALLIGIIVGTYSSVFIATPVMNDLSGKMRSEMKTGKNKKRFSKALNG
jgi:SecD/SecF fusion protein